MYTSKLHQLRAFWDLTMFERYAVKNNISLYRLFRTSVWLVIILMNQNYNQIVSGNAFYLEEHEYLQPMFHCLDVWHKVKSITKKLNTVWFLPQYSEVTNNKEARYSSYWPSKTAGFDCPKIWYMREWTLKPYFKGMYCFSDGEIF